MPGLEALIVSSLRLSIRKAKNRIRHEILILCILRDILPLGQNHLDPELCTKDPILEERYAWHYGKSLSNYLAALPRKNTRSTVTTVQYSGVTAACKDQFVNIGYRQVVDAISECPSAKS